MNTAKIKLPVKLDISVVAHYYQELLSLIDNNSQQQVHIDAGELVHIDSAGIQLLLALVQELSKQNKTLSWQSSSDVLTQTAAQLGLIDALHL